MTGNPLVINVENRPLLTTLGSRENKKMFVVKSTDSDTKRHGKRLHFVHAIKLFMPFKYYFFHIT